MEKTPFEVQAERFRGAREQEQSARLALEEQERTEMELSRPLDLSQALIPYHELVKLNIPERKRHLSWLPEGGNVMVFGPRGAGKTMWGLGLAASLTTGIPFLKWTVREPVGVLYVDGEMQLDELRTRVTALSPQPPGLLHLLPSEWVFHRLKRDLVLTGEPMRDSLTQLLTAHPDIRIVILDNISCLFAGIDEDKKRDWEPINAWLIRLRHRGLTTVLVHHAGKGGQQRGTSGREDALDTVIQLDRPADYDPREGCHFELKFTKCRSVKGEEVGPLDVRLEERNGQLTWTYKPLEQSNEDKVRALLNEGMTNASEIAEAVGIDRSYAWKLKRKIEKAKTAEAIL
jgi:putative DNA primase/helicase